MGTEAFGEFCALMAALTWACALVLFKRTGETVPPLPLSLFKNIIALILLGVTLLIFPHGVEILGQFPPGDFAILLLSGLLGIALADTIFFYALNLVGVGIISIVDCLYSPMIILFSFLILSEELTVFHFIGIALILAAVSLASRHAPPVNRTRGQIILGVLLGAVALALMTFGIVIAKPVLDMNDFPLIWATAIRLLVGTVALALLAFLLPGRKKLLSVFRPSRVWRISIPASVLGTYVALLFWMAGFKYAKASIAGILSQTSIIFAIILASVILKEEFTRRKLMAVVLAVVGVLVVTLHGQLAEAWLRLMPATPTG